MKWIEVKMRELGVTRHTDYKIAFFLDSNAMITVDIEHHGNKRVKPLGVIWGKLPQYYNPNNTIMFDDVKRNFLMNPQNGLTIEPFRQWYKTRETDRELFYLAKYLKIIADYPDLSILNHRSWKKLLKRYNEI